PIPALWKSCCACRSGSSNVCKNWGAGATDDGREPEAATFAPARVPRRTRHGGYHGASRGSDSQPAARHPSCSLASGKLVGAGGRWRRADDSWACTFSIDGAVVERLRLLADAVCAGPVQHVASTEKYSDGAH